MRSKYKGVVRRLIGWDSPYFSRTLIALGLSVAIVGAVVFGIFNSFSRFLNDEFVVMTTESMSDYTLAQKVEVESSIHEVRGVLSSMRALAESIDPEAQGETYATYLQAWNEKGLFRVVYSSMDDLEAALEVDGPWHEEQVDIIDRLKAGQSVVSEVRKSERYDGYYYSIAEPVVRDDRVVSVLRSVVDAATLLQTSQEDTQVTLISSLLVKKDGTIVPVRHSMEGLAGVNLFELLRERGGSSQAVDRVSSGIQKDNEVITTVIGSDGGSTVFMTIAPLGINDWNIVNFTEESDLARHADHILEGTVKTGASLVVVGVAACVIMVFAVGGIRRRARRDAERYAVLAEFSDTVLLEYSYASDVLELTPNAREVFRLEELSAQRYLERGQSLIDVHEDDYDSLVEALENPHPDETCVVICRVRSISDEYRWFSFTFRYLYEGSQPYRAVVKIVDVDDQRKKEEQLERRLRLDGLTGVLNKLAVQERIEAMLDAGDPGILFVIDVDDFKRVNDSYGHSAGDRALATIARVLREVFGQRGVVGRVGGDEFAGFVLSDGGLSAAREMQATLRAQGKAVSLEVGFDLGMSVGMAFFPEDGKTYQELFDAADSAMYEEKRDKDSL